MRYRFKEPVELRDRGGNRVLGYVEITIDWARLKRLLGSKALWNKSGKTMLMKGIIMAKAKKQHGVVLVDMKQ